MSYGPNVVDDTEGMTEEEYWRGFEAAEALPNRFVDIREWAHARNLIEGGSTHAQMLKGMEEFGEIAHAVARKNIRAVADGIGDVVVVLTILAEQHGLSIEDCIELAWNEIKDRKGRMENGIFIKEADLK